MTDLYDIELWNAEGTESDARVVNSTELDKVVRDFKSFVTWSSLSILKGPKSNGKTLEPEIKAQRVKIIHDYLMTIENHEAAYVDIWRNCWPFTVFGNTGRNFNGTLTKMVDDGILERISKGRYRIVEPKG